jgi:hypothetical protein
VTTFLVLVGVFVVFCLVLGMLLSPLARFLRKGENRQKAIKQLEYNKVYSEQKAKQDARAQRRNPQATPPPPPPPSVQAGWYPDANNGQLRRYWDGTGWTEHTAPGGSN